MTKLALAGLTMLCLMTLTLGGANALPLDEITSAIETPTKNPCNGVVDQDCTCKVGVYACAEGENCKIFVAGDCIEG